MIMLLKGPYGKARVEWVEKIQTQVEETWKQKYTSSIGMYFLSLSRITKKLKFHIKLNRRPVCGKKFGKKFKLYYTSFN